MHYSKNGIWNFGDVDTESIKPKAPNGASGGVEYEAMRYLVGGYLESTLLHRLTSGVDTLLSLRQVISSSLIL